MCVCVCVVRLVTHAYDHKHTHISSPSSSSSSSGCADIAEFPDAFAIGYPLYRPLLPAAPPDCIQCLRSADE